MNDPSPESALAEVLELIRSTRGVGLYEKRSAAYEFLHTHGAHFAAMAERAEYLASELALARGHVSGWKLRCAQWQEQAERAESERDAAVRNEQRYLWLRECDIVGDKAVHSRGYTETELLTGDELDAAIDAAMGKGEGNGA